jgi:Protein of unknown function (DUF3433)
MARQPRLGIKANRREKRWTPASLSTLSLALTFALFVSLLISLLLLKYAVNRGNGFVLLSRNPYTWVYGPTALLVIVTSIWRQVDYHCKALRPWEGLQKGPAPAERTLLLDLVSPLQPVSFFNAVTKSHLPVVVTISGRIQEVRHPCTALHRRFHRQLCPSPRVGQHFHTRFRGRQVGQNRSSTLPRAASRCSFWNRSCL